MRFAPRSKQQDEDRNLRTPRQIELYLEREKARQARAERREVEARVRHLNFELIQRMVVLTIGALIGVAVSIGVLGNPDLLKLAVVAASALAAIATALSRSRSRPDKP